MNIRENIIVWKSKNNHIIISKRESFYNNDEMFYCIYQEKRNYKFTDEKFYELEWKFIRYEYNLIDAIKYCNENLIDKIII